VRHLLSKIAAGGLSAGVILLWWPLVFPSDTVESWLIRGVTWTFCFELMLHSFAPIEESLWRSRAARGVAARAQAATAKLGTAEPRKRHHGRMALAALALTVPLTLLATAPDHNLGPRPAAAATKVRHVTEVRRVVKVERRTVTVPRAAAPVAGGTATPQAAGTTTGLPGRSAVQRTATRSASPRRSSGASTRSNTGRGGSAGPRTSTPADSTSPAPSAGTTDLSGEHAPAAAPAQP
jgi:hypothetical protein